MTTKRNPPGVRARQTAGARPEAGPPARPPSAAGGPRVRRAAPQRGQVRVRRRRPARLLPLVEHAVGERRLPRRVRLPRQRPAARSGQHAVLVLAEQVLDGGLAAAGTRRRAAEGRAGPPRPRSGRAWRALRASCSAASRSSPGGAAPASPDPLRQPVGVAPHRPGETLPRPAGGRARQRRIGEQRVEAVQQGEVAVAVQRAEQPAVRGAGCGRGGAPGQPGRVRDRRPGRAAGRRARPVSRAASTSRSRSTPELARPATSARRRPGRWRRGRAPRGRCGSAAQPAGGDPHPVHGVGHVAADGGVEREERRVLGAGVAQDVVAGGGPRRPCPGVGTGPPRGPAAGARPVRRSARASLEARGDGRRPPPVSRSSTASSRAGCAAVGQLGLDLGPAAAVPPAGSRSARHGSTSTSASSAPSASSRWRTRRADRSRTTGTSSAPRARERTRAASSRGRSPRTAARGSRPGRRARRAASDASPASSPPVAAAQGDAVGGEAAVGGVVVGGVQLDRAPVDDGRDAATRAGSRPGAGSLPGPGATSYFRSISRITSAMNANVRTPGRRNATSSGTRESGAMPRRPRADGRRASPVTRSPPYPRRAYGRTGLRRRRAAGP